MKDGATLGRQIGGNHYSFMAIQPAEYCFANMTIEQIRGAMRWNIEKYIWRNKEGITDLEKAEHYLQMWIAQERRHAGVDE